MLADAEVDIQVQAMTVGPELDAAFWDPMIPAAPPPPSVNVAELMAQLTGMGAGGGGLDPNVPAMDAAAALAAAIPQDQLQSLLSQLNPALGSGAGAGDPNWAYGAGDGWDGGRGGGGRGGGRRNNNNNGGHRNSKRKPCSFFQAGRRALHFVKGRIVK